MALSVLARAARERRQGLRRPRLLRVRDRRQKRVFRLPRIEPRVLNDYRDVGLEYARVIRSSRNLLGVTQLVEAQMLRSPRRHGETIRAGRLAVREVDRDRDVRIRIGRVEN